MAPHERLLLERCIMHAHLGCSKLTWSMLLPSCMFNIEMDNETDTWQLNGQHGNILLDWLLLKNIINIRCSMA